MLDENPFGKKDMVSSRILSNGRLRGNQPTRRKEKKMRGKLVLSAFVLMVIFGMANVSQAVVIDFTGGTAFLSTGATVSPTDDGSFWENVDYYIEDGIKIDFIGGYGIIGNYYGTYTGLSTENNSVIHAHWDWLSSIVFSKEDGTTMDLNYMDLSSNTTVGGGAANGTELSYVTTNNGDAMLLPSSDWGINYLSNGSTPGDGIERLWMDTSFDNILSFTVTSQNAFCFGLDNFYIDEPAPPNPDVVPEPGTVFLTGLGLIGLLGLRMRRRNKI